MINVDQKKFEALEAALMDCMTGPAHAIQVMETIKIALIVKGQSTK